MGGSDQNSKRIPRVTYQPSSSFADDMRVIYAMWFAQIGGETHQDKLESFYNKQAHLYDSYRCRMLHGRAELMNNMPVEKGATWVDLGGGTASNIEFFNGYTDQFKSITVVDLTPSLVQQAKKRVEKQGWKNVEIILGDATDPKLPGLPAAGTCDVVSISYALTMIPDWRKALDNAYQLLKPGGHICICDFTVADSQTPWMRWLWKSLFATDHVHLNPGHIVELKSRFNEKYYNVSFGTFPYVPPLFQCPYHVFIGEKRV